MSISKTVLIAGPYTRDIIKRPGLEDLSSVGGSVYYTGWGLQSLSVPFSVLASVSNATQGLLNEENFSPRNHWIYSPEEHCFIHNYQKCVDNRLESVHPGESKLSFDGLTMNGFSWIHLGTLLSSDLEGVDLTLLSNAYYVDVPISMDVQGLIRTKENDGIKYHWPDYAKELLSLVTVLKMNEGESEFVFSQMSLEDLFKLGVESVIVTKGAQGASLFTGSAAFHSPGIAVEHADPTGCGDSFMAGFIAAKLKGRHDHMALELANFLGSECAKVEGPIRKL